MISEKIIEIARENQLILTGYFNTWPDSVPYNVLVGNHLKDVFLNIAEAKKCTCGYTHNSWKVTAEGSYGRIDYVFYKGDEFVPVQYHVLDGQRGKLFISDHFPVIAEFKWEHSRS